MGNVEENEEKLGKNEQKLKRKEECEKCVCKVKND